MRKTEKIFYEKPTKFRTRSTVVKLYPEHIELASTVAYPEGGGQDSDKGTITNKCTGMSLNFDHVKRIYGRDQKITDDHWVNVDGIILHHMVSPGQKLEKMFLEGDPVDIEIDEPRREKLSISHSASHLLFMGIEKLRPFETKRIIGCHIREDQARFDLRTENKFEPEDLAFIEKFANALIAQNLPIKTHASEVHSDARFWICDGVKIPCGGTHVSNAGTITPLKIKRKGLGKNKERLSCLIG